MTAAMFNADITSLKSLYRGKVRDIYEIDAAHMLIVTTDRISAFDVVLPTPIPGKGEVLTAVSNFWFARLSCIVPNHLAGLTLEEVLPDRKEREAVRSRSMVVKRLQPLPVEAIVRGYLIGSGWKEYRAEGSVCGITLPAGLRLAERLPEPVFTPSSKAAIGDHDENVSFDYMLNIIGADLAEQVRDISLRLYREAAAYALQHGIIVADTKFEFGLDENGALVQIDESLTPDSSRFWPVDSYRAGISPPSFDKQFVRDWLETLDWDKKPPGPEVPADIVRKTADKYREALIRLTR